MTKVTFTPGLARERVCWLTWYVSYVGAVCELMGSLVRMFGPVRPHTSGRTTPRIGIEPAPAIVTSRPGRGAWTIAPSPMYIATWLASAK